MPHVQTQLVALARQRFQVVHPQAIALLAQADAGFAVGFTAGHPRQEKPLVFLQATTQAAW